MNCNKLIFFAADGIDSYWYGGLFDWNIEFFWEITIDWLKKKETVGVSID
jgi:hypothetical protein